jgi:hypothetical protein
MALGPYVEKVPLELIFSSAISGASGYRINDKTITLDYTEEVAVSQVTATKSISVQPYEFARFEGDLKLNPESDFFVSDKLVPTTTNQSADNQGLNNLVGAATQPGGINSTILPVTSSDDLLLNSLVPINAAQFTGGLISTRAGVNVPSLANFSEESIWGVLNSEPAATIDTTRTVDGQRPLSSLVEFFGSSTDTQPRTGQGVDVTVIENSLGVDSARRTAATSGRASIDVDFLRFRYDRR